MSLSLHSSAEYLGGSNRWSRNERDMVPEKSSMGLISSKISSSPDCSGTSLRPAALAASTRSGGRADPEPSTVPKYEQRRRGENQERRRCAMLPTGILPNLWRTYHRTHARRPTA